MRPTVASVDLGAIVGNARALAARAPGARLVAVIKADAYGHGAVACARALLAAGVAQGLAVSLVEEGVELRAAGITAPILVLAGPFTGAHGDVLEHGLTPLVSRVADLEAFGAAAGQRGERAAVQLKVDTGMARLGLPASELAAAVAALGRLPLVLEGVATHLACADVEGVPGEEVTQAQLARFDVVRAELAAAGLAPPQVHAANSAGLLRFPASHHTAVRPGLALYGVVPPATTASLAPALRWTSAVLLLRDVTVGEAVSYGGHWRARRPSRLATVPVGYADGYPRRASGRAQVLVGGRACPVVGTISMDLIVVDVTEVAGASVGDEVVLLGTAGTAQIRAEDLAAWSGTIPYEVLTGVGKRVPRVYVPGTT